MAAKSEFEKTMDILESIDKKKLEDDLGEFTRFERMCQLWGMPNGEANKIYPLIKKLENADGKILDTLKICQRRIQMNAEQSEGQITKTEEYKKYSDLFDKMVSIGEVYNYVFNHKTVDTQSSDHNACEAKTRNLFRTNSRAQWPINVYFQSPSDNRKDFLKFLVGEIKEIAESIDLYINDFYKEKKDDCFKKYERNYAQLKNIKTSGSAWAIDQKTFDGVLEKNPNFASDIDETTLKLAKLAHLAEEKGDNQIKRKCNDISKKLAPFVPYLQSKARGR